MVMLAVEIKRLYLAGCSRVNSSLGHSWGKFQFFELLSEIGERPKRGEWGVRVVGWHRYARQPGGGFNVAAHVEAGA